MTSEHQERKFLLQFQLLDPFKQQYKVKRVKLLKIFSKKFGRFLVVVKFIFTENKYKTFLVKLVRGQLFSEGICDFIKVWEEADYYT